MLQPPPQVSIKPELDTAVGGVDSSKTLTPPRKLVILADLNANPPESDDPDSLLLPAPGLTSEEKSTVIPKDNDAVEGAVKKSNKKCRSRISKADALLDCGADADGDQPSQWAPSSREEKGLVHVARKMPKNAHAHFILGLMYQRLGQPQKAFSAYEKAAEILLRCETEIAFLG